VVTVARFAVAAPQVEVSTVRVSADFSARLTSERQEGTLYAFVVGLHGRFDWREMSNELEGAVIDGWLETGERSPVLRSSLSIHASVSGAGAASFAVIDNQEATRRAASDLPGDWFVDVGSTLGRRSTGLTVRAASDGGRR
jgi:4-diphosphocytidyl-2C-methyl-D-erythritol kinase